MNHHPWLEALALLALAYSLLGLLAAWRKLRGTTLWWAWIWCLPAVAAWGAVELGRLLYSPDPSALLPWRYLAGVLSLAPGVSLLGARRPHHRAWQWVVVSLLGVLLLPLGHWALGAGGRLFGLHGAWRGFLGLLLLLQWLHYGLTRHAAAALLVVMAQGAWLAPVLLPQLWKSPFLPDPPAEMSLACVAVALAVGWVQGAKSRREVTAASAGEPAGVVATGRLLQEFRNWFGDFWFQRLRWQVMLAAQRTGWPVWITPTAAVSVEPTEAPVPGWEQAFRTCVEQFLRRFVSPEWIEQRLSETASERSHVAIPSSGPG